MSSENVSVGPLPKYRGGEFVSLLVSPVSPKHGIRLLYFFRCFVRLLFISTSRTRVGSCTGKFWDDNQSDKSPVLAGGYLRWPKDARVSRKRSKAAKKFQKRQRAECRRWSSIANGTRGAMAQSRCPRCSEPAHITDVKPFLSGLLRYNREEMLEKHRWKVGPFKDIPRSKKLLSELQSKDYVRY